MERNIFYRCLSWFKTYKKEKQSLKEEKENKKQDLF